MNKYVLVSAASMIAAAFTTAVSASACDLSRGGFLAGVGKCIAPDAAPVLDALDDLNGQLGNPIDHAGAAALDTFVPGAGQALEGAWAIQRGMGGMPGAPSPIPQGHADPGVGLGMFPGGGAGMGGTGQHCMTPVGLVGPGVPLPLGAPCWIGTPMGQQIWGVIVP